MRTEGEERRMPIRPQFRKFYGRTWREQTRPRILARAKGKCEQCGKPDRTKVWVYSAGSSGQYWHPVPLPMEPAQQRWTYCLFGGQGNFGMDARQVSRAQRERRLRKVLCVLTVAHLNHVAGDDRDDNLKALCQWCHLHHDLGQHHETRATRKDSRRPLLVSA